MALNHAIEAQKTHYLCSQRQVPSAREGGAAAEWVCSEWVPELVPELVRVVAEQATVPPGAQVSPKERQQAQP
jgi:hypothetical protein